MFVPAFITKTLENLHEQEPDEVLIVEDSPQPENVTQNDISTEDDNKEWTTEQNRSFLNPA